MIFPFKDPSTKLEELRRNSLLGIQELRLADHLAQLSPLRQMPETSVPTPPHDGLGTSSPTTATEEAIIEGRATASGVPEFKEPGIDEKSAGSFSAEATETPETLRSPTER